MAPPLFVDLGRSARDVFFKGYNFGFVKSDTTTKSGDIEFKTNVAHSLQTGKLAGAVDLKYKIPQHGTTITERWNTDNVINMELLIDNKIMKGLKLVLDTSYAPFIGKRTGKVRAEYRHDKATLSGELKSDGLAGPVMTGAAVFSYNNMHFGYQTGYDPTKGNVTHNHFGAALDVGDFSFHSYVQNAAEFGGSVCHKVNKELELAANMSWISGEQTTRFGVAAKYDLDRDTVVRAKVNNASQMAVALTHALKPNFKITVSAAVNMQNLTDGSHKLGLGVEYTP